jgi:hypothetical protein
MKNEEALDLVRHIYKVSCPAHPGPGRQKDILFHKISSLVCSKLGTLHPNYPAFSAYACAEVLRWYRKKWGID